ncbi:MAG TPA: tetratricopeptide repeat protein [Bacteroidia bacterium]|nr:tetratricopeptide repeat protein [Bacteroidia bacterium]HRS58316.1 tetratricopeptide repeat protein [Bacteroidia bacterium]HRU69081.1 tetratricopeptide repeat protein [Bacteroidia bacterium]
MNKLFIWFKHFSLPVKLLFYLLIIIALWFISTLLRKNTPPQPGLREDLRLIEQLGFLNLHDTVEYTGIDACRKCHADMYQAYIKTGMGQSWDTADLKKSALASHQISPIYDEKNDLYYLPFWQNNHLMVKEYRLKDGDTTFIRTEKVAYAVGSGQHTNSHILNINGYLYQVPFTFYTQKKILDFPPGFEGGNNSRFGRMIGFECISCHNAYPSPVEGSVNKYSNVPHGIDCERCHGPGELHVRAMELGHIVNTKKEADYTIVNPKRLPRHLADEICARCHNQGNSVLKEGKTFFDFRPGMEVSSVLEVFREVYENDEDAFWMETHPERLKKSKCYQKTQNHPDFKPLSCLDCHFTSGMKHISYKETPVDTFRQKCLNCHGEGFTQCKENQAVRNSQSDNCMTCHLVKTGVFDIPHVVISDHFIRITDKWKKEIKSTREIETGRFLGLKSMSSAHPDALTRARAFLYHYEKFYSNPSLLDSALFYLKKYPVKEYFKYWVYYYYLRKNFKKITRIAEKKKIEDIRDAVCYYQIGQAFHNRNHPEQALKYYQFANKYEPFNLDYRNKTGSELILLKKYQDAMAEFNFIIRENPLNHVAYNNLGFIYLIQNDLVNAEKYFRTALKLHPDYLTAHLNLVKVFIGRKNYFQAKNYLQSLIKRFPDNRQIMELSKIVR